MHIVTMAFFEPVGKPLDVCNRISAYNRRNPRTFAQHHTAAAYRAMDTRQMFGSFSWQYYCISYISGGAFLSHQHCPSCGSCIDPS
jgi:hypothetical protein